MVFCFFDTSRAQEKQKIVYACNTGIGYYKPINSSEELSGKGLSWSFSIQLDFPERYFVRGYLDMPTCHYSKSSEINGMVCFVDDNLNISNLGLSGGYSVPLRKFSAFGCAGVGLMFLSIPYVESDGIGASFKSSGCTYLQYTSSIGVNYQLFESVSIYLETQYSASFTKTGLDNIRLRGFAFLFGVKTPLW